MDYLNETDTGKSDFYESGHVSESKTPSVNAPIADWFSAEFGKVKDAIGYHLGFHSEKGDAEQHETVGGHIGVAIDRIAAPVVSGTRYILALDDEHGKPEMHETVSKHAGTVVGRLTQKFVDAGIFAGNCFRSVFGSIVSSKPIEDPIGTPIQRAFDDGENSNREDRENIV